MPQENPKGKVKRSQQMIQALELRAAGKSYSEIGEALTVSKGRAWKIVAAALDELVERCAESAEKVKQLELHRLDRYRAALDGKRSEPRVADTLIRISERVARLHGIDAPTKIEASGLDGGPIQIEEKANYDRLTLEEMLIFDALQKKVHGVPNWDENIRSHGDDMHVRGYPGKPLSFLTVYVRALLPETVGVTAPVSGT